ncbi:MAG: ATP-binding protein [Thermoleophilia bacterium]
MTAEPRLRPPGLQTWLMAALIGVGALAAAAVLLTVFPTLETSLRKDSAESQGRALLATIRGDLAGANPELLTTEESLDELATLIAAQTGAEVEITRVNPDNSVLTGTAPRGCCLLLDEARRQTPQAHPGVNTTPGYRTVWVTDTPTGLGAVFGGSIQVDAAAPARGVSNAQLQRLQRRLILAVAAVLGLAALAGYGLSRLVGKRIAILARTSTKLAAGDLSARAPVKRLREFAMLGASLNTMAARIEQQVGQITTERDRAGMLISSLAEGVVAIDDDGSVTSMNPAARRLLGVPDGVTVMRAADLPVPVMSAVAEAVHDPADGQPREVLLPGGTELQLIVVPVAAPAAGMVVTMRDVTDARQLERARRDLVANVSHELKTPLAAIKGLLELLQGPRVTPEDRTEFLDLMDVEAKRLERLVEEQLQLARLDSGGLPLERERFDLDALADGVVSSRRALAEAQGVRLRADAAAGPVPVFADPARVEQILLILLDNALRHTPPGGQVEVLVGTDGSSACMAVADTGEGIPLADQPYVFDRFYRGDPSREGRSAGLGLPIARGLAQAHGGVIDLRSAPGAGSTFTLRLPMASPPTAEYPVLRTGAPPE